MLTMTTTSTDEMPPRPMPGPTGTGHGPSPDPDRPPVCPVCHRRLVILASRSGRDKSGGYVRRQLWGCPRGHATASYVNGSFGEVERLPSADRDD